MIDTHCYFETNAASVCAVCASYGDNVQIECADEACPCDGDGIVRDDLGQPVSVCRHVADGWHPCCRCSTLTQHRGG